MTKIKDPKQVVHKYNEPLLQWSHSLQNRMIESVVVVVVFCFAGFNELIVQLGFNSRLNLI